VRRVEAMYDVRDDGRRAGRRVSKHGCDGGLLSDDGSCEAH